jgi:hypothetical protein
VATREELHKLIDSLPDGAVPVAGLRLEMLQTWPEQPSPEKLREQIRRLMAERWKERKGNVPPTYMLGGIGSFGIAHGSKLPFTIPGGNTFGYKDGDTYVLDTRLYHEGHLMNTTEKMRLDRQTNQLLYTFEVTGPDGKTERHEFAFDVSSRVP